MQKERHLAHGHTPSTQAWPTAEFSLSVAPGRFKLARTVAILTLPIKATDAEPELQIIPLAAKAPPRCTTRPVQHRKRKRNL